MRDRLVQNLVDVTQQLIFVDFNFLRHLLNNDHFGVALLKATTFLLHLKKAVGIAQFDSLVPSIARNQRLERSAHILNSAKHIIGEANVSADSIVFVGDVVGVKLPLCVNLLVKRPITRHRILFVTK